MDMYEYRSALKLGRHQFNSDLEKGVYPYLQVLEEITQNVKIISEVPLGLCTIPLDQVVGTNDHGRSTAFARNFMPLLKEDTEFAFKWASLAEAHEVEGIRDPIKCYEFMNRFYVVEGNKRVSVLKHFGALDIPGEVTRLIPMPDGSVALKIYQEFLVFYRITKINYITMTREGSYQKLMELVGKLTEEDWTVEFKKDFRSCYSRFVKVFDKLGGYKLDLTPGDAFLEYLKLFDMESITESDSAAFEKSVESIWKNIALATQETPIALHMEPEEEAPKSIVNIITEGISDVFGTKPKKLKVAFVYGKTPETSGWTYAHERGRKYLEEAMKDEIEITKVEDTLNKELPPFEILDRLAKAGNEIIFTTTPELAQATEKAALLNPKVKFLNCSVNMAVGNIRTYYGRIYEAKFLSGLIAGTLTEKNRIAYIADYPISGMIAGINAFARGVQLVNPQAKVYLLWSTKQGVHLENELEELDVDMVSDQDRRAPITTARHHGLYQVKNGEIIKLARPFWNWGYFYERIIQSIQSGTWQEVDHHSEDHAINYWWGMSSGVIDIVLADDLPEGTRQLVSFYKKAIIRRNYNPFDGVITDQEGQIRSEEDGYIPTANILTMDWLLSNIVGSIPTMDELVFTVRNLVKTTEEAGETSSGVTELKLPNT